MGNKVRTRLACVHVKRASLGRSDSELDPSLASAIRR